MEQLTCYVTTSATYFTLLRRKPQSLRPWMNAWRVPYEAHTSVVGYASEDSALRSMWRSHELKSVEAPPSIVDPVSGGFQILFKPREHLLPAIHGSMYTVARAVNRKEAMTSVLVCVKLVCLVETFELFLHASDILR